MKTAIYLNLPVADLKKSMDFYTKIGFTNNPDFTDDKAAAMVLSDEIGLMLLSHDRFADFTSKQIADLSSSTSAIYAIQVNSIEEMNQIADAAMANGGRIFNEPQDNGFMQQRSFQDPDGHLWEAFFMDMSKFPQE